MSAEYCPIYKKNLKPELLKIDAAEII